MRIRFTHRLKEPSTIPIGLAGRAMVYGAIAHGLCEASDFQIFLTGVTTAEVYQLSEVVGGGAGIWDPRKQKSILGNDSIGPGESVG